MAEVLVVEDSPDQAAVICALLESGGHTTRSVESGQSAIDSVRDDRPDAVVTDLVMPGVDGLELVQALRADHPTLPVILVTAFGSGEIAVRALKKGAASYVPKRRLAEDLLSTLESVLHVAHEKHREHQLLESLVESRFRFVLPNEEELIPGLVQFLQDRMNFRHPGCDENLLMQIGIAVQEAVRNAMHHGNLEVSSELRQESTVAYDAMVKERLKVADYSGRQVTVDAEIAQGELRCTVLDEGPGFDPSSVPDPTDPENLLKTSGRGLYLITTFMDEVVFNSNGNEILMKKNLE